MILVIEAHAHLRDFRQAYKETVRHGLEVARDSGVSAVFDMPNTDPPIIDEETLLARFRLAREANVPEVAYGVYLGITADTEQLKRAVDLARKYSSKRDPRFFVAGMKLYAGESVGSLAVRGIEEQYTIYETLARMAYEGVVPVHSEKDSMILRDENGKQIWNPKRPMSHCSARPPQAEVQSIKEQINFYEETGAKFKLHIPHITYPESVEVVNLAKEEGMDISSGVCPHHLFFDQWRMSEEGGLWYKVNPPLRSRGSDGKLREQLFKGMIDWVETDHAPHTLDEKLKHPYMSGITGLQHWPFFIDLFRHLDFSEGTIQDLTFYNIQKRFGLDLDLNRNQLVDRTRDYPFDHYSEIKEKIGWAA